MAEPMASPSPKLREIAIFESLMAASWIGNRSRNSIGFGFEPDIPRIRWESSSSQPILRFMSVEHLHGRSTPVKMGPFWSERPGQFPKGRWKIMASVDKDTANWRLFGGGGLLVGGLLWLLAVILGQAGVGADVVKWLGIIGLIVVAIGFFLVAWGQTGSNGAVGKNMLGKVGLWAAAVGTLLWALLPVFGVAVADTWGWVVAALIVVGTLLAAVVIMQNGTARGLAKWAMWAVFLLALLYFLGTIASVSALASWVVGLVFAIVVALTGLIYLLNKK